MAAWFDSSDGAKPPSSPWPVAKPRVVQLLLERVEDLGAGAQGLAEGRRPDGHDHELLEVGRVRGVLAAVEDVELRHRQRARAHAAEVAVERHAVFGGHRVRAGERDAEDGVGAQLALVGRAVEVDQQLVDGRLVGGVLVDAAPAR